MNVNLHINAISESKIHKKINFHYIFKIQRYINKQDVLFAVFVVYTNLYIRKNLFFRKQKVELC